MLNPLGPPATTLSPSRLPFGGVCLPFLLLLSFAGCGRDPAAPAGAAASATGAAAGATRPAILLVTLDTTRADSLGAEVAPSFGALAARGLFFTQAYTTAPSTLTAHTSMMTGLYPAGHGIHENGRYLAETTPLLAADLAKAGYDTAAFVSGYPLTRQFGLARGFARFDDDFGVGHLERSAVSTTEKALAYLASRPQSGAAPLFLWVHFFDPHEPYAPPEPFKSRFAADLYRGEIAAMDEQLGRLLAAFEAATPGQEHKIAVLGDHGEGRGEHGELYHGNLLYQGVMHIPLLLAGDGITPGRRDDPVSSRQIRATLLDWAQGAAASSSESLTASLADGGAKPLLGEAMQPFLNYRWQPQVMAVGGRIKLIRSGRMEIYDVVADPQEENDLAATMDPERALARAIADYPLPAAGKAADLGNLTEEDRRKLASLGYVASTGTPLRIPENAPRPVAMAHLFAELDAASRDFVAARYAAAAPRLQKILRADPGNLMVAVQLAVCDSLTGRDSEAQANFDRAKKIDPESIELRHYQAMHYQKTGKPQLATPLFAAVLAAQPNRYAALAGLARIRRDEDRAAEAVELYQRALPAAPDPAEIEVEIGLLRMELGDTAAAITAFEKAREAQGTGFRQDLELGVLYLAQERFVEARDALDRVPPTHPAFAMALFKRAQVSVLLGEGDSAERIRRALERADGETRELIRGERLFAGLLPDSR